MNADCGGKVVFRQVEIIMVVFVKQNRHRAIRLYLPGLFYHIDNPDGIIETVAMK